MSIHKRLEQIEQHIAEQHHVSIVALATWIAANKTGAEGAAVHKMLIAETLSAADESHINALCRRMPASIIAHIDFIRASYDTTAN